MERTVQGIILLILAAVVTALTIMDSSKNLSKWGDSRKRGCEDKGVRNFAIFEMIGAYVFAFVMALVVTDGFFWG